mmetsp:Transcript_83569/g.233244  ORF Transcript_83569/g.233244 Transcript_83569/m.233244 type:complete len:476 (-) Transcript_83569:172-1599(-)
MVPTSAGAVTARVSLPPVAQQLDSRPRDGTRRTPPCLQNVLRPAATAALSFAILVAPRRRHMARWCVAVIDSKTRRYVATLDSDAMSQLSKEKLEQAERSRSYLHLLGPAEVAKLRALRDRLPIVIENVRKMSDANMALLARPRIWGIDIEGSSEAADIVLLKYLRAEDLDVERAADRLVKTLIFRAERRIEALEQTELLPHFQGHDTVRGVDAEGRPVLISRYGSMDNRKVFGDPEAFVNYRLQVMEQAVAQLKFERGAAENLCQVHDYSGVSIREGLFKSDQVKASIAAMQETFSAHYPETKGKTVFVNFPTVFSKLFQAFSIMIPERTRRKFVILAEADQALLFDHIPPDVVPVALGGMLSDSVDALSGPCLKVTVNPRGVEEVTLSKCGVPAKVAWELRVCANEVAYELVFVSEFGGAEVMVCQSDCLSAEDGVIRGEYRAEGAGVLLCRFRNDRAWFSSRLCICRAQTIN